MTALSRRSFLAGLIAAPVIAGIAPKVQPRQFATISSGLEPDETLTGRIVRTLKRRKALGQRNGAIYISQAGHERLQREWGCEPELSACLSVRGVACVRIPEITAVDDYWVVERHVRA